MIKSLVLTVLLVLLTVPAYAQTFSGPGNTTLTFLNPTDGYVVANGTQTCVDFRVTCPNGCVSTAFSVTDDTNHWGQNYGCGSVTYCPTAGWTVNACAPGHGSGRFCNLPTDITVHCHWKAFVCTSQNCTQPSHFTLKASGVDQQQNQVNGAESAASQ